MKGRTRACLISIAAVLAVMGPMTRADLYETTVACDEAAGPVSISYRASTIGCAIDAAADVDAFSFEGKANDVVRVTVVGKSTDLDPSVELRHQDNSILFDEGCDGDGEACSFSATATLTTVGTHTIEVSDTGNDGTGDYILQIERIPSDERANLPYEMGFSGEVSPESDIDFFYVDGDKEIDTNVRVTVRSTEADLDPYLEVWDANGNSLGERSCDSGTPAEPCELSADLDLPADQHIVLAISDIGNDESGAYEVSVECIGTGCPAEVATLFSAVLPGSRSPGVNQTATAFATIINAGPTTAAGCTIAPITELPMDFLFQTADATNTLTRQADAPVDIPIGAAQAFVIALTPTDIIPPTDIELAFACVNGAPVEPKVGLNTLLISASDPATVDVIGLVATPNNNGIVDLPENVGALAAFSMATINVGAAGSVTATMNTGSVTLPMALTICETTGDPLGACLQPRSATVTTSMETDGTATFAVFVEWQEDIPFDPANNRIFVQFEDDTGARRGATSVAIRSVAAINTGPARLTNLTSATFAFSSESGSAFECSLDSQDFVACSSPTVYENLADGVHTFQVRTVGGDAATWTWRVDTQEPDTQIISAPDPITMEPDATFVVVPDEPSTFECSLDGGDFLPCGSPTQSGGRSLLRTAANSTTITFRGLAEGTHTVLIRAIDTATNVEVFAARHTWIIDRTPPEMTSIVVNSTAQYAVVVDELTARIGAEDKLPDLVNAVGVTGYLITEHNATDPQNIDPPYEDPDLDDPGWVTVDPQQEEYSETVTVPLDNQYDLGDAVELCVWFRDRAGNISTRICDDITIGNDWESGLGNWFAENGVWQVGTPSAGPTACASGSQCAATILDDVHPATTDSRLISPTMALPAASDAQEVHLRFRHWFSYSSLDSGQVQIQVWDPDAGSWGDWISVGTSIVHTSDWTLKDVDLTPYAGQIVRLGFNHVAARDAFNRASESWGWYIDDIEIVVDTPALTGDFEAGWQGWGAGRGVWQIGTPTAGPTECISGTQCAGTVLDGNYPANTDSRLVSATTELPTVSGPEGVYLRFQHWFSYSSLDSGQVQVQVWDPVAETWGDWNNAGAPVTGASDWTLKGDVDLTAFAGQVVRLGFLHTAARDAFNRPSESTGWYIDDVGISVF